MNGIRPDLIVPLSRHYPDELLEFWRWLIPDTFRPLFATAIGDLFVVDPDGSIWWLNVGIGDFGTVATSETEFERLVTDPDNASVWFGEGLVDDLRSTGAVLGPGECYTFVQLPVLGGEYETANFRVCDVINHFRVWGPIHEQIHDLPDGTQIEFQVE